MKRLTTALIIVLLFGCTDSNTPTWLKSKILKEIEVERKEAALAKFTPENLARNPSWRTLLPAHATYHPYPGLQTIDSWVVPDSLNDVASWYRAEMKRRDFVGTLRQCTPDSIFGGRIVIIDYCSVSHYIDLRLAEDSIENQSVILIQYWPRGEFQCDDPLWNDFRDVNTQNCPVELLP